MLNEITSLKSKGISTKCLNLPTGLVQAGFFRNNKKQFGEIENKLRKENIILNEMHCNIVFGITIFSYFITTHQNEAIADSKNFKNRNAIKIEYGQHTPFLKALKERQRHRIADVEKGLDYFIESLNPENEMTVNGKTFSIFTTLVRDHKNKTVFFTFNPLFIEYLSNDKHPFTYIQVEELQKVNSNKTGATIFLMNSSMSGINKEKYLTKKYLAQCLGFTGDNSNQKIDNALKGLNEKGIVQSKKVIKKSTFGGKVYYWSMYVFGKVVSASRKLTKKMKKEAKKLETVNKSLFTNTTKKIDGYKGENLSMFENIINSK